MTVARIDRSLIAALLIACIVLGAFSCALRHASSVGFALALGQPLFCSSTNTSASVLKRNANEPSQSHPETPFNCPLCSTISLNIALMFCLSWLLRSSQRALPPLWVQPVKPHPRLARPRLNPRASPRTA